MALGSGKELFRAVIVISKKISFLPEVIPPIDIYYWSHQDGKKWIIPKNYRVQ